MTELRIRSIYCLKVLGIARMKKSRIAWMGLTESMFNADLLDRVLPPRRQAVLTKRSKNYIERNGVVVCEIQQVLKHIVVGYIYHASKSADCPLH